MNRKVQTWLPAFGGIGCLAKLVLLVVVCSGSALTQTRREFHQSFATSIAQPVSLDVELSEGDLEIAYSREGEVSVFAVSQYGDANVPAHSLAGLISITSSGNQIEIRQHRSADASPSQLKIAYRIDVPYRTEVHSVLKRGRQTITGIMGPVSAEVKDGGLKVSYVAKAVAAEA